MSNPYGNNRSHIGNMFKWLGIYMGIGLAISFVLPFPISLLTMFVSIIGIDYLRARYIMKKMGITNIRQMFGSFSAPQTRDEELKYYCMSCGTEHREASCPKCGSKMTRVGWLLPKWTFLDAGNQKGKCTVLNAYNADRVSFPASILKRQFVENAFKKLNHWTPPLIMKKCVSNVVTEE